MFNFFTFETHSYLQNRKIILIFAAESERTCQKLFGLYFGSLMGGELRDKAKGFFDVLNMSESSGTLGSGVSVKGLAANGRLSIGASDST